MSNSNFVVHNGLTIGPITISATSGNIDTSGSVTATSFVGSGALLTGLPAGSANDNFTAKTGATGTVDHDCSVTTLFRHATISANFTVNLTNLTLPSGYATNISLILIQGATAYYPGALQIAGTSKSVNWAGGTTPTPNANKIDAVSFSIINNSDTYTVLGQLSTYG